MKIYYGVRTRFFDNGKVDAAKMTIEHETIPENTFRETVDYDEYIDWFKSKAAADTFYADACTC